MLAPGLALSFLCLALNPAVAPGQTAPTASPATARAASEGSDGDTGAQGGEPVSYASLTQLNGMLAQLDTTSKNTQADLVRLRIERWKTDTAYKRQALGNVDSIQRNLQEALPEIVSQLRAAPEDVPASFKLYRNLDALYDVLGSIVESTGAFGSKDDLQSLANDLNGFENTRKQMAERIESLSSAKEAEIVRLRADLKTARAAAAATPPPAPKKIIIDDNEPAKKPVKKKPAAKPKTTTTPAAPNPPAGQNPPAQQQNPQ